MRRVAPSLIVLLTVLRLAFAFTVFPDIGQKAIAEVVSRQTGIPVSSLTAEEKDRLLGLEEHLHRRVVGQEEAVRVVSDAVLRSRAVLVATDPDWAERFDALVASSGERLTDDGLGLRVAVGRSAA